jgi:hypothetical protein
MKWNWDSNPPEQRFLQSDGRQVTVRKTPIEYTAGDDPARSLLVDQYLARLNRENAERLAA